MKSRSWGLCSPGEHLSTYDSPVADGEIDGEGSGSAVHVRMLRLIGIKPPTPLEAGLDNCVITLGRSPVVGDDCGEEICGDRRLDDGGLELLVKWKGGEETWESYENVTEAEALDEYERHHGRVGVDRRDKQGDQPVAPQLTLSRVCLFALGSEMNRYFKIEPNKTTPRNGPWSAQNVNRKSLSLLSS